MLLERIGLPWVQQEITKDRRQARRRLYNRRSLCVPCFARPPLAPRPMKHIECVDFLTEPPYNIIIV